MAATQTPMHGGKRATWMAGMPNPSRGQGHPDYGPGYDSAYDRGDGPRVHTHGKKYDRRSVNKETDTRVDAHVTPTGVSRPTARKTSDLRSINKGTDSRVNTHVTHTCVLRHAALYDAPPASINSTVSDIYAASRTYQRPRGYDVTPGNQEHGPQVGHCRYPDDHNENARKTNEIQFSNISDAIAKAGGGDPSLHTRGLDGSPNIRGNPDGAKKDQYNYSTNERPSRDPKPPGFSPTATGAETPVTPMAFRYKTKGPVILIYKQDITKIKVDVIVNGANAHLRHEGGVARAIADAAGSELTRASEDVVARYGPVPVSGCVATPAGRLPCQRVLHAVGPKWTDTPEKKAARQLQDTFVRILEFCYAERVTSIAIPPISAGIYGGAAEKVSDAIVKGVIAGLKKMPKHCDLKAIHLVDIDGRLLRVIQTAFADEARKGAVLHRLDRPMDYY